MKEFILRFVKFTNKYKNTCAYNILHWIARRSGITGLYKKFRGNMKEIRFRMDILDANVTMIDRSPGFHYFNTCIKDKAYEPAMTRKINALIIQSDNPVFVDIGAHLGYYSLLAARWKQGINPVYAFEPNPLFFKTLRDNILVNRLEDKIVPFQIALSNKEGKATMTGWDSRIMNEAEDGLIKTTTFDLFCEREGIKPDILKIDVHGAEGKILAGMPKTLTMVSHVFVETHGEMMGYTVAGIVQMMQDAGLDVFELKRHRDVDGGQVIPLEPEVYSEHDDRIIYGIRERK